MKRIDKILELMTESHYALIDIGSDHGYLGISALQNNKIKEVWNVDISKNCLDNSERNFKKFNLLSYSSFHLSDGFTNIKDIPGNSIAVIAGLGTKTILKILQNNMPYNLDNIICLAHNPPISLRKWAWENSWDIVSELYFEDRKHIYLILKLRKSMHKCDKTNHTQDNQNIYLGDSVFLKLHKDLSLQYWNNFKNQLLIKPNKYLLDWEKEFLLLWKTYIESIKLK